MWFKGVKIIQACFRDGMDRYNRDDKQTIIWTEGFSEMQLNASLPSINLIAPFVWGSVATVVFEARFPTSSSVTSLNPFRGGSGVVDSDI